IVEDALEQFIINNQHRHFLKFLRYYIERQEPETEMVHIFVDAVGDLTIVNNFSNEITPQRLEAFPVDCLEQGFDNEDLLISTIVATFPRLIVAHKGVKEYFPRAIDALMRIFKGRFVFCCNCLQCKQELKSVFPKIRHLSLRNT
ncbi:MAG: hypothetical protein GX860_10600, partial [Alcaligenaceae bacterium]|nr:hypothetical protein [Alcaligenaceae bacterium]